MFTRSIEPRKLDVVELFSILLAVLYVPTPLEIVSGPPTFGFIVRIYGLESFPAKTDKKGVYVRKYCKPDDMHLFLRC
jgi:hypothetical protein